MNSSIFQDFISATKTKNYILDDPILDWLNLYGEQNGYKKNIQENKFSNFLKEKGLEFEEKIFNHIRKKYYSKTLDSNTEYHLNYKKTLEFMNNGVPIIFHGVVYNLKEKLFGIPAIIIRSDYINKILNHFFVFFLYCQGF